VTARRVSEAAPLRFLLAILCVWVAVRGTILWGWQPAETALWAAPPPRSSEIRLSLDPIEMAPVDVSRETTPASSTMPAHAIRIALDDAETWDESPSTPGGPTEQPPVELAALAEPHPANEPAYSRAGGEVEAAAIAAPSPHPGSHWSGSAWAFVRGGGRATTLSPGGQIGGGQAGARLLYRLRQGGRLALSARLSRTIGGIRQTEAAAGLDWQPIASVPVHLTAERRIAIDKGGRNAWTLGAAGGLYAVPLGGRWRFDGYAEAGVVGARRRDLYADGAARISRAIDLGEGRSLALGGGLWAAAQPGASRIDLGPTAVLRLPVAGRTVSLALDWRRQVTGHARPHSGVAFTTAVDF
jgi:hypothetical protein